MLGSIRATVESDTLAYPNEIMLMKGDDIKRNDKDKPKNGFNFARAREVSE
jgi:hypothetical protein